MKKIIVVLVLALFLATAVGIISIELAPTSEIEGPTTLSYVEPEDGSTPYFVKKYDDGTISDAPLKVITFTDTHLGNGEEPSDTITLTILDRVLKEKKPDLVIITGDVCLGGEALKGVDALSKVFEENKIYWAVVLGNHDAEDPNGPTREELIRYYEQKPYSLTKEGEIDEGEGNYMINHVTSKGVTHTLVFIDSGAYATPEVCAKYGYTYRDGYDFIKPEQLEWYKNTLEEIQANNNGTMPYSTMFMHIPVVEHSFVDTESFIYGHKFEPSCPSKINSGVFNFVKELGSTKTIVCGHDHIDNYAVMYDFNGNEKGSFDYSGRSAIDLSLDDEGAVILLKDDAPDAEYVSVVLDDSCSLIYEYSLSGKIYDVEVCGEWSYYLTDSALLYTNGDGLNEIAVSDITEGDEILSFDDGCVYICTATKAPLFDLSSD